MTRILVMLGLVLGVFVGLMVGLTIFGRQPTTIEPERLPAPAPKHQGPQAQPGAKITNVTEVTNGWGSVVMRRVEDGKNVCYVVTQAGENVAVSCVVSP